MKKQKLELTWVGKYERTKLEPRVLVEEPDKSYGNKNTDNMLIYGDNLLSLKALEQDFTGKIKCIYIDPPYNTGSAFEHYDDGLEHSIWLKMMSDRLEILKKLLSNDGSIFMQIDSNEMAHLKVLADEIFGRNYFKNIICCKTKIAGVSGSHLGNSLQDNIEYILFYSRSDEVKLFTIPQKMIEINEYIQEYTDSGKSWKYSSVMEAIDDGTYIQDLYAGNGDIIKLYKHDKYEIKSINQIAKESCNNNVNEVYYRYIDKIFRTTNAQTSIRTKVIEAIKNIGGEMFSIEYIPTKGKNSGRMTRFYYKEDNLIAWLKDVVTKKGNKYYKLDNIGNLWDDIQYNNLTKEGDVQFPNGKKPEALIQRVIALATTEGDYVLDSFAGSGTTGSVAHKTGRKWIMCELGEHCHTHIIPRLQRVIDGIDQGGISKAVNWQGGGGFKYYRLAESLLVRDKDLSTENNPVYIINPRYNEELLIKSICKIENFRYRNEGRLHGISSENRFLHVTTRLLTQVYLESLAEDISKDQSLLIYCTRKSRNLRLHNNVEIKKIPKNLLEKCEFEEDKR